MNRLFRVEPEAAEELDQAAQWYEERRLGLGAEFLAAIDDSLYFIDRWPESGSRVSSLPPELNVRRVPVRRFPHHVVYLVTETAIRVLAFSHDHRLPGYWRSRL